MEELELCAAEGEVWEKEREVCERKRKHLQKELELCAGEGEV